MLVYTIAMFILILAASQTLAPAQETAVIDLTGHIQPSRTKCKVSVDHAVYSVLKEVWEVSTSCPKTSSFYNSLSLCCCSNCTVQDAPGLFYRWHDLPHLPLFSEH